MEANQGGVWQAIWSGEGESCAKRIEWKKYKHSYLTIRMRKIKINPKYEYLRAFIESIPDIFEKEGREIYNKRNLIKVLTAPDGTQVNV